MSTRVFTTSPQNGRSFFYAGLCTSPSVPPWQTRGLLIFYPYVLVARNGRGPVSHSEPSPPFPLKEAEVKFSIDVTLRHLFF